MKILITDYQNGLNRDLDFEVGLIQNKLPDAEIVIYENTDDKEGLKEAVKDADIIETALTMLDREILEAAVNLKCICFNSTGFNNVDMDYAKEHGIAVIPVFEYCTEEVATHAMALMLDLIRNIKVYQSKIERQHVWNYETAYEIHRVSEMTLGIFGLGKIGSAVAKRAQAFGMQVIAYDPHIPRKVAANLGVALVSKEEVFEKSDVISNHMMLTDETKDFFCYETFKQCKRNPIFINVARGGSVVEEDLNRALEEGLLCGAGLDVLAAEHPDLEHNPLVGKENVLLTPHAAFYSKEAYRSLQEKAVENIVNFALGKAECYKSVSA